MLLVPTSNTIGSVRSGRMPPIAVYRESLPIGIPSPPAPWSPIPRMRSPSVTTMTSISGLGRFRRSAGMESRSGYEMNSPRGRR